MPLPRSDGLHVGKSGAGVGPGRGIRNGQGGIDFIASSVLDGVERGRASSAASR